MHLEQFIEILEEGLGQGFKYDLNLPESKVEFFIDEDPTSSVFEVTLELVASMNEDDVPRVIEKLFADTIRRLKAKAAKLRNETGGLRARTQDLERAIDQGKKVDRILEELDRSFREDAHGERKEEGPRRHDL